MSDVLDKIDASLEEVEEQLLSEFGRIMDTPGVGRYADVDTGIRNALSEVIDELYAELQNSGDRRNLSLLTDRHEVLYSRIAVLRHLLKTRIAVAHLLQAHEGVDKRRRRLEEQVLKERQRNDPDVSRQTEEKKGGLLGALRGIFDHKPTEQHLARNTISVTAREEDRFEDTQMYLDNGIFSASRELAMIASLSRGGTLDRPPEETDNKDSPRPRGRAIFEARDLSTRPPELTEPLRKPQPDPEPKAPPEPEISKREIAQTPEEIRRKLEARRGQAAAGKASFEARDLSSSTYQHSDPPAPRRREEKAQAPEKASDRPASGKAIFAAKDIEPAFPSDPPRRRERQEQPKEEDEQAQNKKGPAVFEARELSDSPFPKKD